MKMCTNLILYAHGELPTAQRAQFEAHLNTCPACRAELALLHKTAEALVPPAAPQAVVDALFAKTTRKPSVFVRFKLAFASMAALCMVAGFLTVHYTQQPAFDTDAVLAYMNEQLEDEYSYFAQDLDALDSNEDYF